MKKITTSAQLQHMIEHNFQQVMERIAAAARSAGRDSEDVRLVVVTKAHPLEVAEAAVEIGARRLGENYIEEATPKINALAGRPEVEWHMIGHIQSRKAQAVVESFDYVHSLDSLKLARRLDRFAGENERLLPVLLELNVSGEESKFGWPAWDDEKAAALLPEIEQIQELDHIRIQGLMTMAPFLPDPEQTRPYFRRLRQIQASLARHFPDTNWGELSMGMSADFEVAVQEGATIVRIGTAILGERPED
ncbi:MAG TPA: YggS family pyridoxal phosphate-dependent enzyme [Anaerolineales bacterium]|nr:YggS family pyridoxal phosphate-dependent enzyme [Anaerolineales bacterium]